MTISNQARVDTPASFAASARGNSSVSTRLLESNFNVNALRTNDILRLREWIKFDEAVIMVARQRLVAINDLIQAGLTYDVENALGVMQVQWERFSDITDADVSMSGISLAQNDRFEIDLASIPLPIVHKDFNINIRMLTAYRNLGQPLDTTQAALAARVVSEKIESILFNGTTVGSASNVVQGYSNATNRNTGSVTTASWQTQAASTTTAYTIITDVIRMVNAAQADNMYGPYMLYVPVATYALMGNDFKANSGDTILERVKKIAGIIDVKPTSNLTGANVILVQMTSDVVDLINGIQPTIVQWESHGGMIVNFKVLAIMVPRIRNDQTLQSGIVHYS